MDGDVVDLEPDLHPALGAGVDQIADHLLLAVDRDRPAGQLGHRDVQRLALPAQIDAVVDETVPVEPPGNLQLPHQVDRVLLQEPGPHPPFDVLAVTALQHHRLDPDSLEQQGQCQPGRPGADDPDPRV